MQRQLARPVELVEQAELAEAGPRDLYDVRAGYAIVRDGEVVEAIGSPWT